jgi:hypothetical protein
MANPEEDSLPPAVLSRAQTLLTDLSGPMSLGTSDAIGGFFVETHTIGCRNHADDPEDVWWDRHWAIFDEYAADGVSVIIGDPGDGYFATVTPQRGQ